MSLIGKYLTEEDVPARDIRGAMPNLCETSTIEEIAEIAKAEQDSFELCRKQSRDFDERSAVHYYRLGHALTLAKHKLCRAPGRQGRFRAWTIGLNIHRNTVSRSMRLYAAAEEDGGEEALAGLGWYQALKLYGIYQDKSVRAEGHQSDGWQPSETQAWPYTWNAPEQLPDDLPAFDTSVSTPRVSFRGLPGFNSMVIRQLIAFGSSAEEAEQIAKKEIESIDEALMGTLSETLSILVKATIPF